MDKFTFNEIIAKVNYSPDSILQLEAILLKGEKASIVAHRFGISRQTISNRVTQFHRELQRIERDKIANRVARDPVIRETFLKDQFD